MKYLTLRKTERTQMTLVHGETVRDHTVFPPLNEIMAVAMLFVGAMLVFVS